MSESLSAIQTDASVAKGQAPFLPQIARRWMTPFADALFPSRCLFCRAFYDPEKEGGSGNSGKLSAAASFFQRPWDQGMRQILSAFACPACTKRFVSIASPLCPVCGVMFPGREGVDHLCPACDGTVRAFGKARAVGSYEQGWIEAVHRLKYDGKTQLAGPLGLLMFFAFCRIWGEDPVDVVIPVPLHRWRLMRRGYNQAGLLVKNWTRYSRESGMPGFFFDISEEALSRTRRSRPQAGLGRKKRKADIQGAFTVIKDSRVRGKRILIVDDVHTTGATVEACATALREAGALRVDVLTLARTP